MSKMITNRIFRANAILVLLCLSLSVSGAKEPDSFLSILSKFFSKSVTRELEKRIRTGNFDGPRISQGPEHIYELILYLKVARKDYTSALQDYLNLRLRGANILDREEAYARLASAAACLSDNVREVTSATTAMGLQLDMEDKSLRQKLEHYTDAKAVDLKEIAGPRLGRQDRRHSLPGSPFSAVRFADEILRNTGIFAYFAAKGGAVSLRFRLAGGEGGNNGSKIVVRATDQYLSQPI